jgi:catalase
MNQAVPESRRSPTGLRKATDVSQLGPVVHAYVFDGNMAFDHAGPAPVYAPNSIGRPYADDEGPVSAGWEADGEMVRQAYTLHAEDDGWTQAGILVRDLFDDAARDRFVDTAAGALNGVRGDVLQRALRYWRNVDEAIGRRIADQVDVTVEVDGSAARGSDTDPEAASRPEEVSTS